MAPKATLCYAQQLKSKFSLHYLNVKTVRNGDRESSKWFVCNVCQERFSMHKELNHHYKVHRVLGRERNLVSSTELDREYCMKALENVALDHNYYKQEKKIPALIILE